MEINPKSLEKAIAIFIAPAVFPKETPMLQSMEMMERIREVYKLGYEDGHRQKEGDSILKQANG